MHGIRKYKRLLVICKSRWVTTDYCIRTERKEFSYIHVINHKNNKLHGSVKMIGRSLGINMYVYHNGNSYIYLNDLQLYDNNINLYKFKNNVISYSIKIKPYLRHILYINGCLLCTSEYCDIPIYMISGYIDDCNDDSKIFYKYNKIIYRHSDIKMTVYNV